MSSTPNRSGAGYFMQGFSLIQTKGLRRFVLVPLLVNLLLFSGAFYYLYRQLTSAFAWLEGFMPDWLSWLNWILWPLAIIAILVVFSFIFTTITNWIAAPFNGLLAEKVELHLTGQPLGDEGLLSVFKDIPRTLAREWTKLIYYIPRAIGFLLLLIFVPVVGQVLWFLFTAWSMAIQYIDYPYDNRKVAFSSLRKDLGTKKGLSFTFGAAVTLFSMIPIINFLVMPVAICGATSLWVDHYRHQYR